MGQDAATWAMVSAEMGKVVLLSVVRSPADPKQICAVAPGQEVSLAAGPAAKWAVLFDPMSGGGQIPQVPGLPGEPSPEEVTPIVLESGLQYVRPDATAQIVSELASKTLVPGADAGERVQAPPYMTGENGAAWVMQQAAAGQFVIMLRRPYPAGQHARLRAVLPARSDVVVYKLATADVTEVLAAGTHPIEDVRVTAKQVMWTYWTTNQIATTRTLATLQHVAE
jgi:hypothetical protein